MGVPRLQALFATAGTEDANQSNDGRRHFDFLHGRWSVAHRRIRHRLVADTHWDEFSGVCESLPAIGGLANVDENYLELPEGAYRAVTLRLFDPGTRTWSIYWVDGRAMRLDAPVTGRFESGVGRFFGDDAYEGRPVRVRFMWSEIGDASARWEQAFSADSGRSWETNWVMQFTRATRPQNHQSR